jgi:hypothetical protein
MKQPHLNVQLFVGHNTSNNNTLGWVCAGLLRAASAYSFAQRRSTTAGLLGIGSQTQGIHHTNGTTCITLTHWSGLASIDALSAFVTSPAMSS